MAHPQTQPIGLEGSSGIIVARSTSTALLSTRNLDSLPTKFRKQSLLLGFFVDSGLPLKDRFDG
jgi:hypothetical protein